MAYTAFLHPVFLIPYYSYFWNSYKSIQSFEALGTEQAAKRIKIDSYAPFIILVSGIYLTMFYKYIKKTLIDVKVYDKSTQTEKLN